MHTSNTDQSDQTIEDILEAWFQRFAKDEPDGTKTLVLHETYGWEADEEAKYKLSKKLEQLFELEVERTYKKAYIQGGIDENAKNKVLTELEIGDR